MEIKRDRLLKKLIEAKHSDFIKIITGIRRCGKSYLIFKLFKQHLLESGVRADHLLEIDLEREEYKALRTPTALQKYIQSHLQHDGQWNYVLIDEIQLCRRMRPKGLDLTQVHPDDIDDCWDTFYSILSQLRSMPNVDCYVTGSNSKLLSSDVATEFRGRGQVIHVTPLSFSEFVSAYPDEPNIYALLQEYLAYGGMPECLAQKTPEAKQAYLQNLYDTIYLRDLVKRHALHGEKALCMVTDAIMSMIGGLTNPSKLANFIKSNLKFAISQPTVVKHLKYLSDAFLIEEARRFNVRGKHYLDYPSKYYATDNGLRNARTGFRQLEFPHLMENTIYNELRRNGYTVDVGVVGLNEKNNGKHVIASHEIDFVINRGFQRIYVQSAWMIPDDEKMRQETLPLKNTGDNFRKVVIDGQPFGARYLDNDGIGHINLIDFLLKPDSIETL